MRMPLVSKFLCVMHDSGFSLGSFALRLGSFPRIFLRKGENFPLVALSNNSPYVDLYEYNTESPNLAKATLTHNTMMSHRRPTTSGFALALHGNIRHGPESQCLSSP